MHTGRVVGFTRYLGAPKDWDKSKDGSCGGLAVRDDLTGAGPGMTSAWFPTQEEIDRIKGGAPIHLTVLGTVHPPVSMAVGKVPE